jgi:hypothetical protein
MGWWDDPTARGRNSDSEQVRNARLETTRELLRDAGIPADHNDRSEPWVFIARRDSKDWSIESIEAYGARPANSDSVFVLATRTRLALLLMDSKGRNGRFYSEPYTGLVSGDVRLNGFISLVFADANGLAAKTMKLKVRLRGARAIDTIGSFTQSGATKLIVEENIAAARGQRVEFMSAVHQFFKEILDST